MAVALLAVVAAGVLFFVLREDDGSTDATTAATAPTTATEQAATEEERQKPKPKPKPPKPEIETIVVKGGQPVGGVAELTFTKGDRIQFRVRSDAADEVHLHGYDVTEPVAPGSDAKFDVPATIEGVFEAELHHALAPIAEITVEPN